MSRKKQIVILLLLACFSATFGYAKDMQIDDEELASLVEIVKLLRNPGEVYFNKAKGLLKVDEKWTAMNETGKLQATECRPSEHTPSFKLNRILYQVAKEQKRVSTTGTMLSGEDMRYNYSLYERSLKKGKSATYKLRKRYGKQTFVLIPYANKKGCLSILVDGKKPKMVEQEDGTLICSFDSSGKEISLTVTNKSSASLSFVLLNHNSRKR